MSMVCITILILFWCQIQSQARNNFDRLPKPPADYRYFVEEFGNVYKIIGSCSKVKNTSPKSRCIVRINHEYSSKLLTSGVSEKIIGSGVVIQKSFCNDNRIITVLTAFHVVVPQVAFTFKSFIGFYLTTTVFIILPTMIYIRKTNPQHLKKMLLFLIVYCSVCSGIVYCFGLFVYPFLFHSYYRLNILFNDMDHLKNEVLEMHCQVKSSAFVFSTNWWDDIGILQCSNVPENLFAYFEVCRPKLDHTLPISALTPVNVIGFVARSPETFDFIIDPHFSSYLPLITMKSANGKRPEHLLPMYRFMNCTGTLRLSDQHILYIDTPATYGFSGGVCFLPKDNDEWEFTGLLIGEGHSSRSTEHKKEKYVDVESLVTFEELCNETLKYNLLPCVIPEFKTITIGGAIQGIAIESSSFIYGTFDKTVLHATLITGNGQIINSNENIRLWNGIPGSNGTIALIASARVQLIEATQWIHLKYIYYSKTLTFLESIEKTFDLKSYSTWIGDNQILDGIYFSNENQNYNGIIAMSGGCVQSIPLDRSIYKENYFSLFFYEHVQKIFHEKNVENYEEGEIIYEEYLPTIEYLFRYDRGGFWGIECLAQMISILKFLLNQKYFRLIFNYFFQTKILYKIAMLISYDYDEYLYYLRKSFFGFVFMDLWNKVAKMTFSKDFLQH
ncbi:unnamed protein product [Adineta ricciae]|uniref:FAD linked oxidase N-terminal domain-containing protein n=1 Tax=Adineta ricciae TaxID=249248 RepID=A0A816F1T7_ADIRI|nr:unnamed protein product [Adineta ricciae]